MHSKNLRMRLLTLLSMSVLFNLATAATVNGSCAAIANIFKSYSSVHPTATNHPTFNASVALQCLQSVPLDVQRSSNFVDYIEPFWQFQSTLAYLKDPPPDYPLPGADMLGGLAEIKDSINSGYYANQWEFEKDLYALGNILPHDFHVNLPLPLMSVFSFSTLDGPLVSISSDGLSLPEIYFKHDLDKQRNMTLSKTGNWTASPLVKVNDQNATLYLEFLSQNTGIYQDNDANYNQMFYSLPNLAFFGSSGSFTSGGYLYGFSADVIRYTFANGSVVNARTQASTSVNFTSISSGQDLFNVVDLPKSESASSSSSASDGRQSTKTKTAVRSITSLAGYPEPIVMHPDGYTSGYFFEDTMTAILVMQGFIDPYETDSKAALEQQRVISEFLAECKKAKMEYLIVDVQANGGGDLFSGYDALKQIFPALEPFGASRYRATPLVNYMGTIFTGAGTYDASHDYVYQTQSQLDGNGQPFQSWNQEDPNTPIYGDNFTAELRYNLSDLVTMSQSGGINVTGYLSDSNPPPAVFNASNVVMLMDGGCGSTCAIFAEMMKAQGGVRSVAVGGRPQPGPQQGVCGSKGAQVLTYSSIASHIEALPDAQASYLQKGLRLPDYPAPEYIPNINANVSLGFTSTLMSGGRFNLRNNMHDGDETFTPLQFQYEAANCRLFYTKDDIYDITGLWMRVQSVVWRGQPCVAGSTIVDDDTMPAGAYDTVPFGDSALPNIELPAQPGLVPIDKGVKSWASESGSREETAQKAFVGAIWNGLQ
ncbi:3be7d645-f545-49a8-9f74-de9323dcc10e [Sclerotinia trifoliorum]|uniref:3be7d645-f545-49a8-9f74-de9323dcc10e n=1 Tax=Sclerotinia trifoliorum TaxID=28548 RepID=A0A8H2VRD3_9HELO|nr:3be7d645-f545-49a8-9f74-de9323dcc10e [Sclerotinia trifoliorum]